MAELTAEEMVREVQALAKQGDFHGAGKMREQLLAAYPMAIREVVAAAEIIDAEKAVQMDNDHVKLWHELYAPLSQEERNSLFYSTRPAKIAAGKLLFAQGRPSNRLFLIDRGEVTLFHSKGDERHLIGRLTTGEIAGQEGILDITYPTFSAVCQSEVELRYLDRAIVAGWEESFPGLRDKLVDFCSRKSRSAEFQQERGFEMRAYKRLPMEGRITAYILGADGTRTRNAFKGFLQDISRGGISFAIRCSKRETAQALLGRMLDLELEQGDAPGLFRGRIVRVGFHLYNDYSVHVELGEVLAGGVVERMVATQ